MDAGAPIASRIVVLGTAPDNLFGAAKAHRRYLVVLAELGARTYHVSSERFLGGRELASEDATSLTATKVRAEALPESDLIAAYAVGERMAAAAESYGRRGYRTLLIGTYLYPHGLSVLHAASILRGHGIHAVAILVPAGSDVWQIGYGLRATTRLLLSSPDVSARVTYSRRFVEEIEQLVGEQLPFHVIPPPIDVKHFHPCGASEKQACRRALGLDGRDFVLVNCSNMRPVKELGLTLTVAAAIAERTARPVTVALVGPVTEHLAERLRLSKDAVASDALREVRVGKIRVRLAGPQGDPRPFLWSADLAINTSLHDSFNVSLAESMACGVPVLSTDVVGIADVPGVSDVGLFFPLEGDGLDPLRGEGQGCAEPTAQIDHSLSRITEWMGPLLTRDSTAVARAVAARAVVESELANSVIRGRWRTLLEDLF